MEAGEGRTLCILRRYSASLIHGTIPAYASPEQRRFDILEPTGRWKSSLMFTTVSYVKGPKGSVTITGGNATTPWGDASYLLGSPAKIVLGGREVATAAFHLRGVDFVFSGGQTLSFKGHPHRKSWICKGNMATIAVSMEKGKLPPLKGAQPDSTLDQAILDSLPKVARPEWETNRYRQWRIESSGILSMDESDLVLALAMYIGISSMNAYMA